MPKFTITLKDPDWDRDVLDVLRNRGHDIAAQAAYDLVRKYIGDGEYVTLQFDTDEKSCSVLGNDEDPVNDWEKQPDVVGQTSLHIDRALERDQEIVELQRQLDEACDALQQEQDRATPFAMSLIKFIMDTRETLKFQLGVQEYQETGDTTKFYHSQDEADPNTGWVLDPEEMGSVRRYLKRRKIRGA